MDGDGDMDVLSASYNDDKIAWYENDGNQIFLSSHTITTSADGAKDVYALDMDGDGDIDVLSASFNGGKIAWYENDGNENFTSHIIADADEYILVFADDLDNDGDIDVLSASLSDEKIALYDNDGNSNFTSHIISTATNGASSVFAADMDGDGDPDILSASTTDNRIAIHKNRNTVTDINNDSQIIPVKHLLHNNYPNPFNPTTTITYSIPNVTTAFNQVKVQLKVYDILGREVATLVNEVNSAGTYEVKLNASSLTSGIYFYRSLFFCSSVIILGTVFVVKGALQILAIVTLHLFQQSPSKI